MGIAMPRPAPFEGFGTFKCQLVAAAVFRIPKPRNLNPKPPQGLFVAPAGERLGLGTDAALRSCRVYRSGFEGVP